MRLVFLWGLAAAVTAWAAIAKGDPVQAVCLDVVAVAMFSAALALGARGR